MQLVSDCCAHLILSHFLFLPINFYFSPFTRISYHPFTFIAPTCIYSLYLLFSPFTLISPHLLLYVCIYIYICPHIYSYFPPFTRISLLFLFSFCLLCMVLQPTRRTLLSINFPPRPDCSITSELASKVALFVCFRCAKKQHFFPLFSLCWKRQHFRKFVCVCVCSV